MILRKAKTNNPYVMVDKGFVLDINLSFKAKGILLYMLSRPDNWNFYETEIAEHTTDGIKSVRTGIKELERQGYIVRQQLRENGKFKGYEYIVHETSPKCQKRKTVKRKTNNGTLLNNNTTKNNLINKKIINGIFFENENPICDYSFDECIEIIDYFQDKYFTYRGEEHPVYKKELWIELLRKMGSIWDDNDRPFSIDAENYFDMIDRYFDTVLECDYRFAHFMSEGVQVCSFYERCY